MAQSDLLLLETGELLESLVESRKELFNLRFQKATGQLDNSARLGQVRKNVARILTILRQREIAAGQEARVIESNRGAVTAPGSTGAAVEEEET